MSKKNFINRTHVEGLLYEHDLAMKVTGDNSKNPGTQFISGTISIATDDAMTNIVPVHFTYVAATYPSKNGAPGKPNANFPLLEKIINGDLPNVMAHGQDKAVKLRIDSAIALNDFYTDRNGGEPELVSAKRNEGGFIHTATTLNPDEKLRNTFNVDMVITGARRVEADEERNLPEKVIVKGAVFDFNKALLPIEFSAVNPGAMDYFEGLGATSNKPVFTQLKGRQVSETSVRKIIEESAFGEPSVREVPTSRKEFVITWAQPEPYEWDNEETITANELKEAVANREIYLAGVKQRWMDYRNGAGSTKPAATAAKGAFNF